MKSQIKVERCTDVSHELEKAAIVLQSDVKSLGFEVLSVYTSVSEGKGELRELSPQESKEFFTSKAYEEEHFQIQQSYDLQIFIEQEEQKRFCFELDADKSRLFLICQESEYENLFSQCDLLHRAINSYKSLKGVIFKDFSPNCKDLAGLKDRLKQHQSESLLRRRICLEQSEFYSPIVDMHFFFMLQEDWKLRNDNQDLENSSFATKEGMEVGRLIKARSGRDGRNLVGEFVRVEKREPTTMQFGSLEEDFSAEDASEYVTYRSLKEGYVGLNSSGLILIKDFNLEEISYRNMGNLLGGIECDFELNIKAPTVEQDAVGAGIVLEARKINVDGSIDQGVILRAKECFIAGSTHQKSDVYSDYAEIAKHKGSLVADQVRIKNCEGGRIECQGGEIEDCVGGEIYCREIAINHLHANNRISFCSEIEIAEMVSGQNDFFIDSSSFYGYRKQIDEIQKRYQRYSELIARLVKIYQKGLGGLKKITPAIERFKAISARNTHKGLKTQDYILNAIEQYSKTYEQLQQLSEKIQVCKERSEKVKAELMPIVELILNAKITCESAWVNQNQVECVNLIKNTRERLTIEDGERVNVIVDSATYKPIRERRA